MNGKLRLLQCHIDHFGKLSDFDYVFKNGVNVFAEDNAWGKSTLAAFIRVMFYGFDNERKRKELDKERIKYRPWQGGTYGGTITFEAGGTRYIIEKTFGEKSREDQCVLRNADSNLMIREIDAEQIGAYFFQVDSESFRRSVFISQNDVKTKSTDGISAKIGDLADVSDDMNHYESAVSSLKKEIDRLTPDRKTGALYRHREELEALKRELTEEEHVNGMLRSLTEERKQDREKIAKLRKEHAVLLEKQQNLSSLQGSLDAYRFQKEEQELFSRLEERYADGVPESEELAYYKNMLDEAEDLQKSIFMHQLSAAEQEELKECREFFSGYCPDEEEIRRKLEQWKRRNEIKSALAAKRAAAKMTRYAAGSDSGRHTGLILLTAGICAIAAGICIAIFSRMPAGIVLSAAGAVLLLSGLWICKRDSASKASGTDSAYAAFLEELQQEEAFAEQTEKEMKEYLTLFSVEYEENHVMDSLYELLRLCRRYVSLDGKASGENPEEQRKRYEEQIGEVRFFLKQYGIPANEEDARLDDDLAKLKHETEEYLRLEQKKARCFELTAEYEKQGAGLPGDISREIGELSEEEEKLRERMSLTRNQILAYQETLDRLEEKKRELAALTETIREERQRYEDLKIASACLVRAKESLSSKYTEPVKKAFDHYYSLLSAQNADEMYLDANAHVTARQQGQQREVQSLSAGYQDLIGLCLRLAFADVMYEEEKPFLIFDDPFVNLDEKKLRRAGSLLREVEKQYQIIYFTCHESRTFGL